MSTTEAEYIALAQALREFIPMWHEFEDLLVAFNLTEKHPITVKSTIFEDNNCTISTATTPKMTPCTKHIAVKYHFLKSMFGQHHHNNHPFHLEKVDTTLQKTDIFTKGLTEVVFLCLKKLLCNY